MDTLTIELREAGGEFVGTVIQEGRASSDRRELFAPGAVAWPASGIRILADHRGAELARAVPVRGADGRIEVRAKATDAIRAAVADGKRYMSVEFHPIRESRTDSGIREITAAMVDAAALVSDPSYAQTRAELRGGNHRKAIWDCLSG